MSLRNMFGEISLEATQAEVRDHLATIIEEVNGLEESLTAIQTATGTVDDAETLNTIVGRLKRTVSRLDSVITLFGGLAMETTLAAVRARADLLATENTLGQLRSKIDDGSMDTVLGVLKQIYGAVDTLEISSDSVALNADAINLNTDEVETILTALNNKQRSQSRVYAILVGLTGDTETVKVDIFNTYGDDAGHVDRIYKAVCPNDTADDAAAHDVVRVDFAATAAGKFPTRIRYLSAIQFSTREAAAWP